jgi:hypothetical protein
VSRLEDGHSPQNRQAAGLEIVLWFLEGKVAHFRGPVCHVLALIVNQALNNRWLLRCTHYMRSSAPHFTFPHCQQTVLTNQSLSGCTRDMCSWRRSCPCMEIAMKLR